MIFAGVNPAGIRSKWPTWKKIIRESNATVWTMQETKCPKNQLKMDDFIIYENVRGKSCGGGVMIAAKKCLNPVLVAEGDEETEAITIEIHPTKLVVSCTSAYGPQLGDSPEKKRKFWKYLDDAADVAWQNGKGFYLQGDLNAWLGHGVIPCDPRPHNSNGTLFYNFLNRHPQLKVLNSMPLCKGLVTRKRHLKSGKVEESVIDFVVVCSRMLPYVTEMCIDNDNKYITTNYTQTKVKAINSDHNTIFVKMNLKSIPFKEPKREIFNLKNVQCQEKFKIETEETYVLSSCFQGLEPCLYREKNGKNSLNTHIKRSFRKI